MDFAEFFQKFLEEDSYIYCATIDEQRTMMDFFHRNEIYGDERLEEDIRDGNDCWTLLYFSGTQLHGMTGGCNMPKTNRFTDVWKYISDDSAWDNAGSAVDMLM